MLFRNGVVAVIIAFFSLISIVLVVHLQRRNGSSSASWITSVATYKSHTCSNGLDWLDHLDLTYPIHYARRDIIANTNPSAKRNSVTKINQPLLPKFQVIDPIENPKVQLARCEEPLKLDLPPSLNQPVDASHLYFGISTTVKRLEESIPPLSRWLAHTRAKLFVIVIESDEVKADTKDVSRMQDKLRSVGIDATLVHPHEGYTMAERYFSLVDILYTNHQPETQWIGLADDDTFFPSMYSLLEMLDEHDYSQRQYVGALSEDWWSVTRYGLMGFGGAGIFLSIPLARVIHDKFTECMERSRTSAGDIAVKECIYWHTNTKLTHVPELHQIDVAGDLSGFFESGRMPLSVHHWKGGGWDGSGYPLAKMHTVADVCGECFLQRWQFGSDTLLTNGFSISTYPKKDKGSSIDTIDLDKLEHTWNNSSVVEGSHNSGNDHSLGPTRRKMILDEEKIQYRFLDSTIADGVVRQTYFHPGTNGNFDSVIELFWVPGD